MHGVGLHVTRVLPRGTSLGVCVTWSQQEMLPRPKIEELGLHVNHSWRPNASLAACISGSGSEAASGLPAALELILLRDLGAGEEGTSNYLLSPIFIALPWPWPIWRSIRP